MSFERYIIRSEMLRGSREKACKQNIGNFRFSASRASVGMKVIPLESYELAVFYGIIASTFRVLLKSHALDLLQYYFWVLCNGMKTRFRMVMIAHPGPGIGFHKQFMWQIIIPPTPFFANKGYHP